MNIEKENSDHRDTKNMEFQRGLFEFTFYLLFERSSPCSLSKGLLWSVLNVSVVIFFTLE